MAIFCLLILCGFHSPIPAVDLPADQFVPGWSKSESALVFHQQDLYGYIDGGAELFLEFGFADLVVQRYGNHDRELSLDIYKMAGPDAALAIYLAKKGNEQPVPGINNRNTGGEYQITALKGRYFVQVNNQSGESNNLPIMVTLLQVMLSHIHEEPTQNWLQDLPKNRIPGSELLVAGAYSLQMVYTLGDGDVLQLGGKRFGVCVEIMDEGGKKYTFLRISYPDQESSGAVFENLKTGLDEYLSKIEDGPDSLTFKDYKNEYGRIVKAGTVIEIFLHLTQLEK